MSAMQPATLVIWGGFVLGCVFGAVANKSHFCVMGAVSDVVNMEHWGRARQWMLAVAVAAMGATLLHATGLINLAQSVYQRPVLPWLSLLVGGSIFGIGMTLAGGCPNKNLVRLGGGSLRSFVVLVFIAIASYMTLKGLFAQGRVRFLDPVALDFAGLGMAQQGVHNLVAKVTGLALPTALLGTTAVVCVALLAFVFKDKRFRQDTASVVSGIALGLVIVGGWALTGHFGFGENPDTLETVYFATNTRTLESLSFVAPVAYGLEMLMLWSDASLRMTFGIATVLGVVAGSFAVAVASRRFRWEGFASLDDMRTNLLGAVLMGFGGVTSIGCTIGQGLSGLSTLAIGSIIAVAGIVTGSVATNKWLQR